MVKVKNDLTGKTFGRWKVLNQTEDFILPSGRHEAGWLCECQCEKHTIKAVRGASLVSGSTNSCGCDKLRKGNKYDLTGGYGIGWTSNTNEEFYFDLEDYDKIKNYTWKKGKRGYLVTSINNKYHTMHKYLTGYEKTDHKNRNKLDNRKENLRETTDFQNLKNQSKKKNGTNNYIGVSWNKNRQRWYAHITYAGKVIPLGSSKNEEEALVMRLKAEAKYFKDYAPQRDLFKKYGIEFDENDKLTYEP